MEDDRRGAERTHKSQPRVWPAAEGAEPVRSMAENDDNIRPEAGEKDRDRVDARAVGVRERETGLCRQKHLGAGRSEKISRRTMFAGERRLHTASGSGR